MLTLNDGRSELWQWDTGRTLAVDADCSQVHFSNKVFGRSIDVDVVDGAAIIPDILLQTDKDLNVWAFVGTAENGYTKISKTFKVNRRNKPADYVFTPPDQTTLAELSVRLDKIEESQDPDAIKNAVEDYLQQNPVESPVQSVNGQTGTVELNAQDVGAIAETELQTAINTALAQAKASGEFDGADGAPGKDGADGQPGENGTDGYSPTANVTQTDNGATITITDKNGTTTATVTNGKDGADGNPGADGSPGKDGSDGKSAYQYAVEGGYTGTEAEFAEKMAAPLPGVDDTLTQPRQAADAAAVGDRLNALSEKIANLPSGGSGLTAAQISALDGMFKVTAFSADPVAAYDAFKAAFGIEGSESESVPATDIVLDKTTMSFSDATTKTISATVTPANSTDPVVWSTSAPSVATVSGGVVTPVADGSCTITATAGSVSASCEVTVSLAQSTPEVEWEIGGINPQGTLNTNAARLRTTGLIPREYDSVSANDGYELIVCCYAEDGTNATGSVYFNPNDNTVGSLGVYSSGPIDLAGIKAGTIGFTSTYSWFRILLRRTDGVNMTAEEGTNAVVFA